jgi:hypothetical protein
MEASSYSNNKLDQKILNRLTELIEMGEAVTKTSYNPKYIAGTFVKEEFAFQWGTSSLNILDKVFGKDSPHYVNFNNLYPNFLKFVYVSRALGILKAAKDDYEHELLFNIRTLIEAEVFGDFLEQAEHLLESGYYQPSAVIAGSVLEDGLRKLCAKNGIPLQNRPKMDTMNAELAKRGVFSLLQQKQILPLADIRNKAAHGKWDGFDKQDVENMIKVVREIMTKYFS